MNRWLAALLGGAGRGGGGKPLARLLKRYDSYLQLLRANSGLLEQLAELEAMASSRGFCGGEKVRATVTRLIVQLYAMAKRLQYLSGDRREDLTRVIGALSETLQEKLRDLPARNPAGPFAAALSKGLALEEDAVGGKAAHLAAMAGRPGIRLPEAFVITIPSFLEFLRFNDLEGRVRSLWDTLDPAEPNRIVETGRELRAAVLWGTVPPAVELAVREQMALLMARQSGGLFAVRSSASGEDSVFSFAGQYKSVLCVPPEGILEAWREVLSGFFNPGAIALRLKRGFGALELGMGALVMPMVKAQASGVAYSRDPFCAGEGRVRVEAVPGACSKLVDGSAAPEICWVDANGRGEPEKPGGDALSATVVEGAWGRIAALAREAESALRSPSDIEWALDSSGTLWLIQARPAALRHSAPQGVPPPHGRVVLAEGGVRASAGAACGPVLHVSDCESAAGEPRGFVAVAPEASPDLALLLPGAAAVVTERGGALSHLGAVAREFGVPALFGVAGARRSLPQGRDVTVDATEGRIYDGKVEEVLVATCASTQYPDIESPVLRTVRSLIPHVIPLRLADPQSPAFEPENCRSVHDVVRYIHEKALAAVSGLGDGLGERNGEWGWRIREQMPMDLWIIPLGSGAEIPASGSSISVEAVTSPLARALFDGFRDPSVARKGSGPAGAMGFLSVVSSSMTSSGELGAPCWALISDRYLHLSSRIGYHFTTVEALSGKREGDNNIRFFFKGGAAGRARREYRAVFIAAVLDGLGFKVKQISDLVSASCSQATLQEMQALLGHLGRLLVCSGRLDMVLADAGQAARYSQAFLDGRYSVILDGDILPGP